MPDNAADLAADYATSHGFKILRVAAGMRQDALAVLADLEMELLGTLANTDASKLTLNAPKYQALLAEAKGTITDAYTLVAKNHGKSIDELTTIEWNASNKMLNNSVGVEIFSGKIPPKLLEAVAQAPIVLGHSSKDWWAGQAQDMRQNFQAEMAKGILIGETTPQLIKRIRGAGVLETPDPTAPKGILAKARRDAEALVLTSVSSVTNHARIESFKAKPGIIKGIQWLSTLDSRTTMICMALDGKQWRLPDFKPVGHDKAFPGPTAHWRCRSTQVAVMFSWSELAGKKLPELDDQDLQTAVDKELEAMGMSEQQRAAARVRTRASMDGQVSKKNAYGDWAAKKGADYLNEVLGPGRAALYNSGQMTFSDLTDQNNRPITLAQLAASVASGKQPPETLGVDFPTAPKPKKFLDVQKLEAAAAKKALQEQQAAQKQIDAAAAAKIASFAGPGVNLDLALAAKQILKTGAQPNAETLGKIEVLFAEKKAYAAKISTISAIKKKWLAQKPFSPAEQKVWDAMSPEEAVGYMQTWGEIQAAKAAQKAAEDAAKLAAAKLQAAQELAKQQAAAAAAKAKADADAAAAKAKADAAAALAASKQASKHKLGIAKAFATGKGLTDAEDNFWQTLTSAEKDEINNLTDSLLAKAAKPTAKPAAPANKSGAHKAPKATPTKPVKALANEPTPAPDKLTFVRGLGGTTGAELHQDSAGALYVVKRGAIPDHVREESAADDIYRALGVRVPAGTLHETPTGPVKVTRFEADAISLAEALQDKTRAKAVKAALQEDLAVDILLGNWDVAGASMDNILVTPDNRVIRIDNGGALRYRAMGTAKTPEQWNDTPSEIFTMRRKPNPNGMPLPPDNAHHQTLFGDADWIQISRRIEGIDRAKLEALPIDPALRETLLKRHTELAVIARRTLNQDHDGWRAEFSERQAALSLQFKASGLREAIPTAITISESYGSIKATVDGNVGYGRLRTGHTTNAAASAPPPLGQTLVGDIYFETIKAAVKSVNHHASLGGTTLNQQKLDVAIAYADTLSKLIKSKTATPETKAMAMQYQEAINDLKKVKKAGVPQQLKQFSQYIIPGTNKTPAARAAPVKNTSIVAELHNLFKAKHGAEGEAAMRVVSTWMDAQAGNSWNPNARTAKIWMANQTKDPSSFYWAGNRNYSVTMADSQKQWKAAVKGIGGNEKILDDAFFFWHTMTQDVLTWSDMPYNDRTRGVVRLVRTESPEAVQAAGVAAKGRQEMQRGAVESHSIFQKTTIKGDSDMAFWMAVPHHRVLGTYLTEKTPGAGYSGFASDDENEFASNTNKLPSIHQGADPSNNNRSTNAADWGVPLDHLRR